MKNTMQLKAIIKNISKEKHISAQLVLQNYMLERFLERMSVSEYRNNFIIKGGFLIASIVGLDSRATMDMDATIKNYPVNEDTIRHMIEEIIQINIHDDITFEFKSIGVIREGDEYTGYRVSLSAIYEVMKVPLKLDITTGDKITPCEVEYEYKLMMEDRSISVLAYNVITILAEKLETVISRSVQNTRLRDFYDVYILAKLRDGSYDYDILSQALKTTAQKRGTVDIISQYQEIIDTVRRDDIMISRWNDYKKDFNYASEIDFEDVCDAVISLMSNLSFN